jgi:uncharacterized protein (DUF58 family)
VELGALPLKIRFPRFAVAVQFTTEGIIFVLLSLAIGAAAVNTGNNVLYLIFSLMLALIVVSGVLSRRMLSGLNPKLEFPNHIFAGISNVCYISIENRKRTWPSIGIRLVVRNVSFPSVGRYFFYVPAKTEIHGFAPVVFPRRGCFSLKEMELQTRFPFSFFLKLRRFFPNQEVIVYPRVYRLTDEMVNHVTEGMMAESPYRGESQQLLHLRDYSPFDAHKRIHWKASAKTEKLLVKEFQKEHGRDLYIYFNCYPGDVDDQNSSLFEKAVSFIASLAFFFAQKEIGARIVFPGHIFNMGGKGFSMVTLLGYLSALQPGAPREGKPDLPASLDAMAIEIRSLQIPPVFSLDWPRSRVVLVEDWMPLLKDTVSAAELKEKR